MAKKNQFYLQKQPDETMQWEDPKAVDAFRDEAQPGRWRADFVKERKPKSQSQLGYIFGGIVDAIAEECNERRQDGVDALLKHVVDENIPKGTPATKDLIKDLCYAVAPTYGDDGRKKTLRSMDTKEANLFIDQICNIFAGFAEINDPRTPG